MVMHAELHMAVCSGPMRGRQHTYVAFDQRAQAEGPAGEEALEVLARRYFSTRGPATVYDFAWWAGLLIADARRGLELAADGLEFHEAGGRQYAFVSRAERAAQPAIDFVQCYDEVVVSYRQSRDDPQDGSGFLRAAAASRRLRALDPPRRTTIRSLAVRRRHRFDRNRLADNPSPREQELLGRTRRPRLRQFLGG